MSGIPTKAKGNVWEPIVAHARPETATVIRRSHKRKAPTFENAPRIAGANSKQGAPGVSTSALADYYERQGMRAHSASTGPRASREERRLLRRLGGIKG